MRIEPLVTTFCAEFKQPLPDNGVYQLLHSGELPLCPLRLHRPASCGACPRVKDLDVVVGLVGLADECRRLRRVEIDLREPHEIEVGEPCVVVVLWTEIFPEIRHPEIMVWAVEASGIYVLILLRAVIEI